MDEGSDSDHSAETTFRTQQSVANERRPIMKFDVSAHASADVSAATISMYCTDSSGAQTGTWTLRRIVRTTWAPTTVDWLNYNGGTWTTAGAGHNGDDHSSTNQLTGTFPANQDLIGWYDFGNISSLVTDAIDNRSGILHLSLTLTQNRTTVWSWASTSHATISGPKLFLRVPSLAGEAQLILEEG